MSINNLILCSVLSLLVPAANAATRVDLKNAKNETVGTATLTPMANGVKILIEAQGLTPGEHAFHVHENGVCQAPKFESAGGHFAPGKNPHGFDAAQGPHAGDMPNLIAAEDGKVKAEIINTHVTLGKGANSLFKKGGTALVIHEKADDYRSQPAGNAGGRVACGEIKAQ